VSAAELLHLSTAERERIRTGSVHRVAHQLVAMAAHTGDACEGSDGNLTTDEPGQDRSGGTQAQQHMSQTMSTDEVWEGCCTLLHEAVPIYEWIRTELVWTRTDESGLDDDVELERRLCPRAIELVPTVRDCLWTKIIVASGPPIMYGTVPSGHRLGKNNPPSFENAQSGSASHSSSSASSSSSQSAIAGTINVAGPTTGNDMRV